MKINTRDSTPLPLEHLKSSLPSRLPIREPEIPLLTERALYRIVAFHICLSQV